MIVDTSVLLSVFFAEQHGAWASSKLNEYGAELKMSTVNLAETLIILRDRVPAMASDLEARILGSSIRFIPPDVRQSRIAAQARLRYPLNLGDCFCYALAVVEDCPVLSLDKDFRTTDRRVVRPHESPVNS